MSAIKGMDVCTVNRAMTIWLSPRCSGSNCYCNVPRSAVLCGLFGKNTKIRMGVVWRD